VYNFRAVDPENTQKNDEGLKEDQQSALVLEEKEIQNKIDKKEA